MAIFKPFRKLNLSKLAKTGLYKDLRRIVKKTGKTVNPFLTKTRDFIEDQINTGKDAIISGYEVSKKAVNLLGKEVVTESKKLLKEGEKVLNQVVKDGKNIANDVLKEAITSVIPDIAGATVGFLGAGPLGLAVGAKVGDYLGDKAGELLF